uniref:N-acetyltransferase domain-containing protein n=1 Tax=Hemiselmis tepida TaxID=464990 RepID=A0A7S0VXU4_9CRYP|mmetsp:Transcript_29002/g.73467  ORF Transcript_29002/g.73467 Transcript_29002/m.73467 type:complete len:283 (+) Transcript_29002:84-932(+)
MGAGVSKKRDGKLLLQSLPEEQREGIVVVPPEDEELALTTMRRSFCGHGAPPEFLFDYMFWPLKGHELFKPLPQQSDGSFQQHPDHWACHRWFFRYCLREMALTGLVVGIKKQDGEGYDAVMLCRPPGFHDGFVTQLRAAKYAGLTPPWESKKKGEENADKCDQVKARMEGCTSMMSKCHKECAPEKHWYVYMLQVDPSAQYKGLGTRLLNFVTTLADREGVPTYLETVGDPLVSMYEKKGFKVVKKYPCLVGMEDKIGGPALTEGGGLTGMKRPPSKQAGA